MYRVQKRIRLVEQDTENDEEIERELARFDLSQGPPK